MHNNYFFIRQLSEELDRMLREYVLTECFSQSKDELVLVFEAINSQDFQIIQAHLTAEFSALSFPETFQRARKNSVDLFPEITGKRVEKVSQPENERAFVVHFSDGFDLVFKLQANRSNLILFHHGQFVKLFKNNLKKDAEIKLESLSRSMDTSFDTFRERGLKKTFYTFGKEVGWFLNQEGYDDWPVNRQYERIKQLITLLEQPASFYITQWGEEVILSLLPFGKVLEEYHAATEAARAFYQAHFRINYFRKVAARIRTSIQTAMSGTEAYIDQTNQKLDELKNQETPDKTADVIMANLHTIPKGAEKVSLFNFYTNQPVEIHLKKDQSPQKLAENLYRKAKKRPLEIRILEENIQHKQENLERLQNDLKFLDQAENFRQITGLKEKYLTGKREPKKEPEKFKYFEFMGFDIFVGRNAANNDELTLRYAKKDDLWLHARDVSGSHVVIRNKPGQNFPKPVIEKAAALAAWYSQRKNDSLCPVIVTPKKFVRKVKGTPKGAVKVEKENVVMVKPAP